MNNKDKFLKIAISASILIPAALFLFAYYFVLPQTIDFDKYESRIRLILNKRILYPLELGDLKIDLTWNFRARISTDKIKIKKPDSSKFLTAKNSYLEVSLLPLINNGVDIKKIKLNYFDANITRLENGKFDVSEILGMPEKPRYNVSLKNTDIIIDKYKISYNEKFIKPAKTHLLKGEKIKVNNLNPGKYIKVYALGRAVFKNRPDAIYDLDFSSDLPLFKKENLNLKGEITNLEPDVLIPYINSVSSIKFLSLAGKGDIKFDLEFQEKLFGENIFFIESTLDGVKIETQKHGVISEHKGLISLTGKGIYNNNHIKLDKLKINSDTISFRGSGEVKHYRNNYRRNYIDIKMNFEDSKIDSIALLFPRIFEIKRSPFKNILKNKVKADIDGNMAIKGFSNEPQLFGLLHYSNLTMNGGFKDTPGASGKLDFLGPSMVIKNKVYIDKENFVTVKGRIAPFKEKTINLDIFSTEVDFARTRQILFTLKKFFKIKLGPVVDMHFKGRGKANLNIFGTFDDVMIKGYIETKGLELKYATLASPAKNISGKLRFVGEKVIYDDITGFVENQKIKPSGFSTLDGYSDAFINIPGLDLAAGRKFVNASPLLKEVKAALKDLLKVSGSADSSIHLKGTEEKINSSGKFALKNTSCLYRGFGGNFENISGLIEFKNEDIYFRGTTGSVNGNKVKVTGFIKKNFDSELKIISDKLNLQPAKTFLMASPILKDVDVILKEYNEVSGVSSVEVNLKGNLEKEPLKNLIFKNMDAVFNHEQIKIPVVLNGGVLEVEPDKVNLYQVTGSSEKIDFKINGDVSNLKAYIEEQKPLVPDFKLQIDEFDFSKTKNFIKVPLIPLNVRETLADFDEFHGNMEVSINAKPDDIIVKLIPEGISAVYTPYDTFVFIKEGEAYFSGTNTKLSLLKGVLSESEFKINGFINNYKTSPEFDFKFDIDINYNDIDKIKFYSDIPVKAGGIIPFSFKVNGNVEDWDVFGRMVMEKGSYMNYITDIGLPRDKVRLITLNATGNKDTLNVDKLRVDMSDSAEKMVNLTDKDAEYEGFLNLINVQGVIDKIKSKKPVFKDFTIKTNDKNSISTKLFNPSIGCLLNNGCRTFFSQGNFKADLILNGYIASPEIDGSTVFQDITIPDYNTNIKLIDLVFDKKKLNINVTGLSIGESTMSINASLDSKFEAPVLIKNLVIDSSLFNFNELNQIFTSRYNQKQTDLPPFVITKGALIADKMIINELNAINFTSEFTLTPDWLLSMSKIKTNAAQGHGVGSGSYNIKTTELSADFDISGMNANTLATTLLTLPNEVYGTLDGNLKFSTKGKNYQELIANSNGQAEFQIENGKLVRLGSLEYLLRAVNVIQSGVGGFNINNIIDLIAPKKTGHFEKLTGRIYARDGILYTDDITSSGKVLSLYISGKLDMLTNRTDVQVLGKLSKKISGLLGPVGSVSINQFIDYIPGLGFLPTNPEKKGVIDMIPGLSKIPGLELNNDQKFRRFAVHIDGDLYKQESVKSFRWIE